MDGHGLFKIWFTRHFIWYAPSSRPLLLLMDGHSSHFCPEMIRTAAAKEVILFTLPPHITHLSQPLDKGVFAPLKTVWKQIVHGFIAKNPGKEVTRYDFSTLFSDAWSKSMTVSNISSGFKVTGVFPFNKHAIHLPEKNFSTFDPQDLPKS